MKSILVAMTFLALPAMASTEVFRCEGQFLFPNEDETKIEMVTGLIVVNSDNGKETISIELDGNVMAKDQEAFRENTGKPQLDMIQQIKDIAAENPLYGDAVAKTYGSKIEDTLKNTVSTTFVGYEADDMGAILGHHYDAKGALISTEISVAWIGTGLCK